MNLRLKFLTFLGIFLLGSFLIITWKSFNIFSQKYTTAMGQAEIQKLEVQASTIAQRFHAFQTALQDNKNIEAQLNGLGVQLLAHVINENGKWKAQWFEGQSGARLAAQGVTQQIPFDSLSTIKKTWHLINSKDLGSSLAYVIPALNKNRASYYVFFLTQDFFARLFQGQSQLENVSLVSPYLGEIYSLRLSPGSAEVLEKNKKAMMDQQSGVIPVGNRSMMFIFNPDLQLYLVKTKKLADLSVDKPIYLITLGLIMALLIGVALVAQDILLRQVITENSEQIPEVAAVEEASDVAPTTAEDIVKEVQRDVAIAAEKLSTAAQEAKWEKVINQIRPRAINSLGYLNRLKADHKSPHIVLLESELRELRRLIDPVEGVAPMAPPPTVQPSFNPFSKQNFSKEMMSKEFVATNLEAPLAPTAAPTPVSDNNVLIRKPKRESNESRKL
jgi:hypothetical protein